MATRSEVKWCQEVKPFLRAEQLPLDFPVHKGRPLCRGILLERRMPGESCLNSTCHWAVNLSEFLKFSIHILDLLEQIARTWLHTADTYSLMLLQVRNTQSGSWGQSQGVLRAFSGGQGENPFLASPSFRWLPGLCQHPSRTSGPAFSKLSAPSSCHFLLCVCTIPLSVSLLQWMCLEPT